MSRLAAKIYDKFIYELDGLAAIARYPLHAQDLMKRLSSSMPSVTIETTNICNANCIFCAYQYQERPTGVMSDALFHKVVQEFAECGGGGISLTPTVGDPLVDPHIVDRIKWAKSVPGIKKIAMYSNMISLKRFGAKQLVNSGLDDLTVSTSGFDPAMYQRVYRSKMYKKMLENIKAFGEANNAAGRPVNFKVSCRIDRSIRYASTTPDYRAVAAIIGRNNIDFKLRYDTWAGKIRQEDLSGNMKMRSLASLRRPRISPCGEMFTGPVVYWDGRVGACPCRDVDASALIIGDVSRNHLAEIWFGEKIKQMRREFLTDGCSDICKGCTHYYNLSWYIRLQNKEIFNSLPNARAAAGDRSESVARSAGTSNY